MRALRRFVPFLVTTLLLVLPEPASAQQQVVTRAWAHPDYGRLVFDFGVPVGYGASLTDGRLVVAFDRPVATSFERVLRNLDGYVADAALRAGGNEAVLTLRRPVELRSFTDGTAVVVDLLPATDAAPPAQASASSADAGTLNIRTGEHPGYSRLVFDWNRNVEYDIARDGDLAIVSFSEPAGVDVEALRRNAPDRLRSVSTVAGDGLTLNLGLPGQARLRHFRAGTRVVVDILAPDAPGEAPSPPANTGTTAQASPPAPPAAPAAAPTVPVTDAPAPAPARQPPAGQQRAGQQTAAATAGAPTPILPERRRQTAAAPSTSGSAPSGAGASPQPAPAPAPAASGGDVVDTPQAASAAENAEETDEPQPLRPIPRPTRELVRRVPVPGELTVAVDKEGPQVSLTFPWPGSVGAASFRRAGFLWLVFDEEARLNLDQLEAEAPEIFQFVQQIPLSRGVAVRMLVPQAINPSFRRDGSSWIMDMQRGDMEPARALDSVTGINRQTGVILVFQATSPGQPLVIEDPEVGDTLRVVPLFTPGEGVQMERRYTEFNVLASAQGIAVEPRADGINVRTSAAGAVIEKQGGLFITPDIQNLARQKALGEPSVLSRLLDVQQWERGGLESYYATRQDLLERVTQASRERRGQSRLELARYFFANSFAAEALAVMRVIEEESPTLAEEPSFRLMHAASNFLLGRAQAALTELRHPALADEVEADLWRGAVAAELGDWGGAAQSFSRSVALLPAYNERIKQRVGALAAEAALRTRAIRRAERVLRVLLADKLRGESTLDDRGVALYLQGRLQEARGDTDGALQTWEKVDETGDRLARAKAALARVEMFSRTDRLTRDETIQAYEDLRFTWRGDTIEFQLLQRLGELYLEKGDYRNGLLTLKTAATYFPNHPDAPLVTLTMSNAFRELFLQGVADGLPPITAIALYDEFRELAPAGPEGDEMIRRLADRLVGVDLLDRAAQLLDHQVDFRLTGEEKARIGARLAVVRLLAQEPDKALDALDRSEVADIPETLGEQRRHLRARALIEEGRNADAAVDLAGDDTPDGLRLLAEAQWRQQQWAPVSDTLIRLAEATVDTADGIELGEVRTIVSLAVSLALSDNERALRELRRQYGPEMARSGFRDAFELLSSDIGIGLADFRRLSERIQLAESFQSFMQTYRQRVQEGRLSAIN